MDTSQQIKIRSMEHLLKVVSRTNVLERELRSPGPTKEGLRDMVAFADGLAEQATGLATCLRMELLNTYGEIK